MSGHSGVLFFLCPPHDFVQCVATSVEIERTLVLCWCPKLESKLPLLRGTVCEKLDVHYMYVAQSLFFSTCSFKIRSHYVCCAAKRNEEDRERWGHGQCGTGRQHRHMIIDVLSAGARSLQKRSSRHYPWTCRYMTLKQI